MVAWEPKLVALVLPANFAALGDDVEQIQQAGIDRIQWDVMMVPSSPTSRSVPMSSRPTAVAPPSDSRPTDGG
jgi:hypothetical protein